MIQIDHQVANVTYDLYGVKSKVKHLAIRNIDDGPGNIATDGAGETFK